MNEIYHIPAMLRETIQGLNVQPSGLYVDVTFGGGGHSRAILEAMRQEAKGERQEAKGERQEAKGKLYSFDQDLDAYHNAMRSDFGNRISDNGNWQFVHSNFRYLRNFMDYYGVQQIDGLLADLGVSFHHFDCPERGFSFRFSAPLDMRMNQTGGKTAADILNTYSEEDLARVLYIYGEMKNSRQLAKRIAKIRQQQPLSRTEDLVAAVIGKEVQTFLHDTSAELDIPAAAKKDLAKAFQALRIEVNDEMGALREMLLAAKDLLKPGGRIAILTYHSLEDRIVKNFLRSGNLDGKIEKDFYGNILSPFKVIEKGLTASDEEVERNPRARSAKLRVAEKV